MKKPTNFYLTLLGIPILAASFLYFENPAPAIEERKDVIYYLRESAKSISSFWSDYAERQKREKDALSHPLIKREGKAGGLDK